MKKRMSYTERPPPHGSCRLPAGRPGASPHTPAFFLHQPNRYSGSPMCKETKNDNRIFHKRRTVSVFINNF